MNDHEKFAAEEAARLLGAVQGWLRSSAPHLAPVDADGHPCSCPLCRVVGSVRDADPDTLARYVGTAAAALSGVLAQASDLAGHMTTDRTWTAHEPTATPTEPEPREGSAGTEPTRGVRRIHLEHDIGDDQG